MAWGVGAYLQAMQSAERGKKRKVIVQPTQFAPVLVEILLSVRVAAKQVEQVGRMFVVVAIPFYQSHSFGSDTNTKFRTRLTPAAGEQVAVKVALAEVCKVHVGHSLQEKHQREAVAGLLHARQKIIRTGRTGQADSGSLERSGRQRLLEQLLHLQRRNRQLTFRSHPGFQSGKQAELSPHQVGIHRTVVDRTQRAEVGGNGVVTELPLLHIGLEAAQRTLAERTEINGTSAHKLRKGAQSVLVDMGRSKTALLAQIFNDFIHEVGQTFLSHTSLF